MGSTPIVFNHFVIDNDLTIILREGKKYKIHTFFFFLNFHCARPYRITMKKKGEKYFQIDSEEQKCLEVMVC